jgi:hypothetical protein
MASASLCDLLVAALTTPDCSYRRANHNMFSNTLVILCLTAVFTSSVKAALSICDNYTTLVLTNNTAENQLTLLTILVNTVVIGNYTQPNIGIRVPGILAPGVYDGYNVSLAKFFDGSMNTTNDNNVASMVNFLDGGGAAPLLMNMPAHGNTTNQVMNELCMLNESANPCLIL